MKNRENIAHEVNELVEQNYYAEHHELRWALKAYEETLEMGERDLLRQITLERLAHDPSIVNVIFISCWDIPESVPLLTAKLDQESTGSQLSRAIMTVLQRYSDEKACSSVERFLDSEQEGEALTFLARMDFKRAVPGFKRAMKKEHLLDTCLHILHERRKRAGMEEMIGDLRDHVVADSPYFLERLSQVFTAKSGDFNPFTIAEVSAILAHLDSSKDFPE